jgi:hypothetical protein
MKTRLIISLILLLTVTIPSFGGETDDVLNVEGKKVVFFGPNQLEYDAVSEDEQDEWNEVLSDFEYYRDLTIPYLDKNDIKHITTAAPEIRIQLEGGKDRIYKRKDIEHIVGYILTDGKSEPKLVPGVGTDTDLISDFKEYFGGKKEESGTLKPLLKELLSKKEGISERDRKAYAYVIEHYLHECPGKSFAFTTLEDAIRIEDPDDGTLIVNTSIACDDTKNKPNMIITGEYMRLDADLSLRARLDTYKPVGDLAQKLKEAQKRIEEEERNPPPKPPEDELRKAQTEALLSLLEKNSKIGDGQRRALREVIPVLPVCGEEDGPHSFESIKDAVWMDRFNEGYIAVSLIVCGWDDLDAYHIDNKGNVKGRFKLPAGKYGLGPVHEFRVGDLTGDGQDELYYRKLFPTSSVPVFMTRVYIYKLKGGIDTPQKVLDIQVEEQDCFEAMRQDNNIGFRKTAALEFLTGKGVIRITDEESEFDCDDFSWGKKPVRTIKVVAKKKRTMKWDPSRFSYVIYDREGGE